MKCFITRVTGKGTLCNSLLVRLEMTIETRLLGESLLTALVGFFTIVDALIGLKIIQVGEGFSTGFTAVVFTCFLGRWLTITLLNNLK